MNHTIAQQKAFAAHRAMLNKQFAEKRGRRIEALRAKLLRQMFADRSGWLFAASVVGMAFAVVFIR